MFNYDKLEECIRKSGKTRTYLCSRLGRPAYYLRDVIRQRNSIPEDYQRILADELGVTVAYLNDLEYPGIKTTSAPKSAEVILDIEFSNEIADLTEDERCDVMEYIRFKKSQRGE